MEKINIYAQEKGKHKKMLKVLKLWERLFQRKAYPKEMVK